LLVAREAGSQRAVMVPELDRGLAPALNERLFGFGIDRPAIDDGERATFLVR